MKTTPARCSVFAGECTPVFTAVQVIHLQFMFTNLNSTILDIVHVCCLNSHEVRKKQRINYIHQWIMVTEYDYHDYAID